MSADPHSLPTPEEAAVAREGRRALASLLRTRARTRRLEVRDDKGAAHPVEVPLSALRALAEVLDQIGSGKAVSIVPLHEELTTQEAADLLNVSRPHLVQLIESGEIPFRKIGTHRRLRHEDVMAYKQAIDAKRKKALDELAEQAQELDMGYE
jgi:excisionase family DNA binding protein